MIPVHVPDVGEEEIAAVVEALRRGEISGSFGNSIPQFEREFAEYVGARHGIAVSNGTVALQVALAAGGIGAGDEVLVSASTNIATGLAAYHCGAVPISIDSEDETWNLDLDLIEQHITPKTKAIIPVHLYGHPVDMDRLMEIADRHKLLVVEDCAESHGATVRGKMTGQFGQMGCFSFYANKVITTGEGGMVVTSDNELAARLRSLRNLAFGQPRFLHREAGFNFRMTGYQAAMGIPQVRRIEKIIAEKRRIAKTYSELLSDVRGLQLPAEREWARNVYWMYAVVVRPELGLSRDELSAALLKRGIETRTFFCPMNLQPCFEQQPGYRRVECPVAERLWTSGLYLPSSNHLQDSDIHQIVDAIRTIATRSEGR